MTTCTVSEDKATLDVYLGRHFRAEVKGRCFPEIMVHNVAPVYILFFAQRIAQTLISRHSLSFETVLDIWCRLDGFAFQLTTTFDQVDAFDDSPSFVHAAKQSRRNGTRQPHWRRNPWNCNRVTWRNSRQCTRKGDFPLWRYSSIGSHDGTFNETVRCLSYGEFKLSTTNSWCMLIVWVKTDETRWVRFVGTHLNW